jgi:hypothetical protein
MYTAPELGVGDGLFGASPAEVPDPPQAPNVTDPKSAIATKSQVLTTTLHLRLPRE